MENAPFNSSDVIIFVGSGLLVICLMFGFILYLLMSYRQKRKDYLMLDVQKQEIDRQKIMLEKTLLELQSTQAQLIQSEKMASLGELVAGISHEIQNPLNFVNNFSELNQDLIGELKEELEKGNIEEVVAIADDISINEQRIREHGKRAETIIKSMLEHSRSSNGQKESVSLNNLCDEYLRITYQECKVKFQLFDASYEGHYDENVGMVDIFTQDIGRVILNLMNNAFYSVHIKKQQSLMTVEIDENVFIPRVVVTTKKTEKSIQISIKDNGMGIPSNVLEKIFQPFFTTKPAGQGTGLGLSLSFDIVKAHGGDIKVITKENEGAEFIVSLPR
ncbi:MAG: HAMP domain-containing sensor histidine kinase [Saprospiraceae bacterium]